MLWLSSGHPPWGGFSVISVGVPLTSGKRIQLISISMISVYEAAQSPSNGDNNGNVSSLNCLSLIVESIVSPHRAANAGAMTGHQMAPLNSITAVASSSGGSGYESMMMDTSNVEQETELVPVTAMVRSSSAELTDLDAMHTNRPSTARPASVHSYSTAPIDRTTPVAGQLGSHRTSPVSVTDESMIMNIQSQGTDETRTSNGNSE
jgi:hypothetical protein